MQIAILGRQAEISLAELECLFGADSVVPVGKKAALVQSDRPLPQVRLGGTIKSGQVIKRLNGTDIDKIFDFLHKFIVQASDSGKNSKLKIGFSLYGFDIKKENLLKKSLQLKKQLRSNGLSSRIVENKSLELSSAQVLYNKLVSYPGFEFLIVRNANETILARATGVQDIDDYARRDFGRPKRDARIGMLPPKLAQIIINLALWSNWQKAKSKKYPQLPTTIYHLPSTILDPFCGTGLILQEALLMGYDVLGSDIDPRMCEFSKRNLEWLENKWQVASGKWQIQKADATNQVWQQLFEHVASETYLGRPFTEQPGQEILDQTARECNLIIKKFLTNIHPRLVDDARLCLAVPAWSLAPGQFRHLPVIDQIEDLGYNRIVLKHAKAEDLVYHRENQIVARELLVLTKK